MLRLLVLLMVAGSIPAGACGKETNKADLFDPSSPLGLVPHKAQHLDKQGRKALLESFAAAAKENGGNPADLIKRAGPSAYARLGLATATVPAECKQLLSCCMGVEVNNKHARTPIKAVPVCRSLMKKGPALEESHAMGCAKAAGFILNLLDNNSDLVPKACRIQ